MSRPVVSRLWIAAAERALDEELVDMPEDTIADLRSRIRVAAITAEDLMNRVDGPRGGTRSATTAELVERFGDHAVNIHHMGAAFIEEAVASALREVGVDATDADRVAGRCRAAVLEAGAAIDTLSALTTG